MSRKLLYLMSLASMISGCVSFYPNAPVTTAKSPVAAPAPPPPPAPPPRAERSEALLQALLSLGLDYKYGGKSPVTGFDCSGLVAHVYREAWGIQLPMNTKGQS